MYFTSDSASKTPFVKQFMEVIYKEVTRFSPQAHSFSCTAGHVFKTHPAHLLGKTPCWANIKQNVLSCCSQHQRRNHIYSTWVVLLLSSLCHLATAHSTLNRLHIICSVFKLVRTSPLDFTTSLLTSSSCAPILPWFKAGFDCQMG